jgi:hypothetical protein
VGVVLLHTGRYVTNLAHQDSQKMLIDASIQVIMKIVMVLTLHTGTAKRCSHVYAGVYEHLTAVPVCKVGATTTCGCRASAYRSLCY